MCVCKFNVTFTGSTEQVMPILLYKRDAISADYRQAVYTLPVFLDRVVDV